MSITVYLGCIRVYVDVMNQAKSGVMLANADFPNLHSRSAVTGIHILEDGEENGKAYLSQSCLAKSSTTRRRPTFLVL